MNSGTSNLVINEELREIIMTRTFDAPRELVYRVWTDVQYIPRWWGPREYKTVVEKNDVQPGGLWRFIQYDPKSNEFAFNGEYRLVEPPEKLVYTFDYEGNPGHIIVETVTFEEKDGQTIVTSIDRFQTMDDLHGMLEAGMEKGATDSYERLTELLREVQRVR